MKTLADKRKLQKLLSENKDIKPKKYNYGNKTVVVMPSPVQKKDFSDYKYGLDIDEKVVKMATKLAERMAIAMVRETLHFNLDAIVDKICDNIVPKLKDEFSNLAPQQIYIDKAISEAKKEIKEFVFEKPKLNIDRSQGIEIKGEIGKKSTSEESTDKDLDALDKLL